MKIRALKPEETKLLEEFLYLAIFVPEGVEAPPREIIQQPELKLYYEAFGSGEADYCLAAEEEGQIVGMAWTRLMHDYGYVDDHTPSYAIAVLPQFRGRGIGTQLLAAMRNVLKENGWTRVSLAVQKQNRAVHLYRRAGFQILRETDDEYIMVQEL